MKSGRPEWRTYFHLEAHFDSLARIVRFIVLGSSMNETASRVA